MLITSPREYNHSFSFRPESEFFNQKGRGYSIITLNLNFFELFMKNLACHNAVLAIMMLQYGMTTTELAGMCPGQDIEQDPQGKLNACVQALNGQTGSNIPTLNFTGLPMGNLNVSQLQSFFPPGLLGQLNTLNLQRLNV